MVSSMMGRRQLVRIGLCSILGSTVRRVLCVSAGVSEAHSLYLVVRRVLVPRGGC